MNGAFSVKGFDDLVKGKIVINLWISQGKIGIELNLSYRQACRIMAEITKAMSSARSKEKK